MRGELVMVVKLEGQVERRKQAGLNVGYESKRKGIAVHGLY